MAKLTLSDVVSGYASATAVNANNTLVENALENTLSRDGTSPNAMMANLDMNSYKILNLAAPTNGGDAARLQDVQDAISGATTATLLSFTPYETLDSTNVQAVIQEIEDRYLTIVRVNDFGAIGDGTSHPLSETYATLAAAQVDYPAALALTDEKDWCAWQACADYIYSRTAPYLGTYNFSAGRVHANGMYVVNRTITFNNVAITIEGENPGNRFILQNSTGIQYNGAAGTVDAPVYIIDSYIFDELGNPPPGRVGNSVVSGGCKTTIKNMVFFGKEGSMTGVVGNESAYVSGIRIRKGFQVEISNCAFGGTLWDGIKFTDAQLFPLVTRNWFYEVYRDAIAQDYAPNFTTTARIIDNEFGYVGRYAILMDCSGGVEVNNTIQNNSFEHSFDSFFVQNPEWWVHGVIASECYINCSLMNYTNNRHEGLTDITGGYYADIHLIASDNVTIVDGVARNLMLSTNDSVTPRNAALISYRTTYGHGDITNTRNYNCGPSATAGTASENLTIKNIFNFNKIWLADGKGMGVSNSHIFENDQISWLLSIPVIAGTHATKVTPRTTALVSLVDAASYPVNRKNSIYVSNNIIANIKYGDHKTGGGTIYKGSTFFGTWAATTAYVAKETGLNLSSFKLPLTPNGFVYQCIVAGTSGGAEPVWPTTPGNTVVDGTCTWKCIQRVMIDTQIASEVSPVLFDNGKVITHGTAAPTTGYWFAGDARINTDVTALPVSRWVNGADGTAGPWMPEQFTRVEHVTPAAGASITAGSQYSGISINTTGTLATLTLTMPASPVDGQTWQLSSGNTIVTALTHNPNAGQTLLNASTTLGDGARVGWVYRASNTTWYRYH